MIIFILLSCGPFFNSISFNILSRRKRLTAFSLGLVGAIAAFMIEDFVWFFQEVAAP